MKDNNKKVPKLRFPGFADDWEQRKYSDVINLLSGQDFEPSDYNDDGHGTPYMTGASCIDNGMTIVSRWTNTPKCIAEKGDVLLVCKGSGCGTIAVLVQEKAHIARQFMALKCTDNLDNQFNLYLANSVVDDIKKDARGLIAGIARDAVLNQNVCIPNIDEQKKIGSFFYNLDNLITLHQRKVDQMKEYKKGMLQKMFPQNGQSEPEIRFPGFTGTWEQRKLIDLLSQPVSDGPHETPDLVEEGIPFISVDAIVDNKIDFDRKRGYITEAYDLECRKKYSPQRDDVYLVKSGATVGKVAIVDTDERFNIWSPLAAMRANKELMLPKYLYFYLQLKDVQDEIYEKSIGGTQPNLSMRVLEQFNIRVPHIDEQEIISDALSNLDNLITLHQCKVDQIKEYKKGLLQQMFV